MEAVVAMEAVLAEAASTAVVVFMEVSLAAGSAEEDFAVKDFADVGLDDLALGPITADTITVDTILTRTAITTTTAAATWSVAASRLLTALGFVPSKSADDIKLKDPPARRRVLAAPHRIATTTPSASRSNLCRLQVPAHAVYTPFTFLNVQK
jgi:hypothetical protein